MGVRAGALRLAISLDDTPISRNQMCITTFPYLRLFNPRWYGLLSAVGDKDNSGGTGSQGNSLSINFSILEWHSFPLVSTWTIQR